MVRGNIIFGKVVKLVFVATIVIILGWTKFYSSEPVQSKGQVCFDDNSFAMTENFYFILKQYAIIRNFLLIVSSGLLDMSLTTLAYSWIVNGKTWRPVLTLSLFFGFREVCGFIFEIREDEDMLWRYPGFPSITVSYHENKEFFYCGTVGLFLICALELKDFGYSILSFISTFGCILQSLLLLSLRAQYYLSLLCGLMAAHYLHIISDRFNYILNDAYDFDVEETERKNKIRTEQNIKEIIETSITNLKRDREKKYSKLEETIPGEEIEISVVSEDKTPPDQKENFQEDSI